MPSPRIPKTETIERAAVGVTGALVLAGVISFVAGLGLPRRQARTEAPAARAPAIDPGNTVRGRVEVLNASGRAGLAREVTGRLRDQGFDVVFFGNAPDDAPDSTMVLVRMGNGDVARSAAGALGIARVRTVLDSTRLLEATVLIGRDWPVRQQDR